MSALTLTPTQRKSLKAIAHALDPVVIIGDAGLTGAVMKEIDRGLTTHELIKVRVAGDDRAARIAILETVCTELKAAPVQHIGKLLVLFRPAPERDMPAPKKPASKSGTSRGSALSRPVKRNPVSGKAMAPRTPGLAPRASSSTRNSPSGVRPPRTERVRASGQRSAKKPFSSR